MTAWSWSACVSITLVVLLLTVESSLGVQGGQTISESASSSARSGRRIKLNVVHYNDIHSHLYPADRSMAECDPNKNFSLCYGGYARLATLLQRIRSGSRSPTLLLDAGDEFTGSIFSFAYRGAEAFPPQNLLGISAMTLGNHEFDYGPRVLRSYLRNASFPIATCNVVPSPRSVLFGVLRPGPLVLSVPQEEGPPLRVGVVGWTTLDTLVSASPGPEVAVLPLVPAVRRCVRQLQQQGVRIILGLGHAGIGEGGDLDVSAQVPGLDLVVGGHSHSFLFEGPQGPLLDAQDPSSADAPVLPHYPYWVQTQYPPLGRRVPYVQAFFGGRYVGNLSLEFDSAGTLVSLSGAPILLGGSRSSNPVPRNATLDAVVARLYAPLQRRFSRVVGVSETELVAVANTSQLVRLQETNLGDLVTDSLLWEINRNEAFVAHHGRVAIAILNGGGIRASIPAGNVTLGHILTTLPFGSTIQIKALTGVQLLGALTRSAIKYSQVAPFGGFLQVAGVFLGFDPTMPAHSRVFKTGILDNAAPGTSGCIRPLDMSKLYTVATCDFLGRGGDNYTELAEALTILDSGRSLADILEDYITLNSPIHAVRGHRVCVGPQAGSIMPPPCLSATM